jgi:hypothetical protein
VFYVRAPVGGELWPQSTRVNSIAGSAIATGTVRGAQITIGKNERIHIAWNGSEPTRPGATPMFYTRLDDAGRTFEPQRNLGPEGFNIDGGGAVAADDNGRVFAFWHANAPGEHEEANRRVWIARSNDDGRTFERAHSVWQEPTGTCGCCGLGAFADARGSLYVLFRSAFEVTNRDMYLLTSRDHGDHFSGTRIDRWSVGMCVMSTQAFAEGRSGVFTAWETMGQVYVGRVENGKLAWTAGAPGDNRTRKHPSMAVDPSERVLLTWTEGTSWNKGGAVAWQLFSEAGVPIGDVGRADGLPVWGLVAAYARPGGFTIFY